MMTQLARSVPTHVRLLVAPDVLQNVQIAQVHQHAQNVTTDAKIHVPQNVVKDAQMVAKVHVHQHVVKDAHLDARMAAKAHVRQNVVEDALQVV